LIRGIPTGIPTSKLGYSAQQFPANKNRELRQDEKLKTSLCRFKMNSSKTWECSLGADVNHKTGAAKARLVVLGYQAHNLAEVQAAAPTMAQIASSA